jgi:hypothetical protein
LSIIRLSILLFFVGIALVSCDRHTNFNQSAINLNWNTPQIKISPLRDTLCIGDTLTVSFNSPATIITDEGKSVTIQKASYYRFMLLFEKNKEYPLWGGAPLIVEQASGSNGYVGAFVYGFDAFPMLGSIIHYVPQTAGWYRLSTSGNGVITCTAKEYNEPISLLFNGTFDVTERNLHLLDSFPIMKASVEQEKVDRGQDYYFFYVKP